MAIMFNLLKFLDEYILKFLKACLCVCSGRLAEKGTAAFLLGCSGMKAMLGWHSQPVLLEKSFHT